MFPQLSQPLLSQIQNAIKTSQPSECCINFYRQLTPIAVVELHAFVKSKAAQRPDLSSQFWDGFNQVERQHIINVMKGFLSQIEAQGEEYRGMGDEDLLMIIEEEDLYSSSPGLNILP